MRVITDVLKNDDVLHTTLTHENLKWFSCLILVVFKWPEVELCKKKRERHGFKI